ncbi:MAG: hypothetical protein M1825_002645 [Sarcosagium campestre]|nr:MAG: hypothetical protein M1825_002645 [Sarcosagium campestre]
MSSQPMSANANVATSGNLGSDLKFSGEAAAKVKDEKAARDECMLFSNGDAQENCRSTIDKYRSCMAGYGFKLP